MLRIPSAPAANIPRSRVDSVNVDAVRRAFGAIRKARKHYHLDWALVEDPGPRFENLVAAHLLKWVHFVQDTEGRDLELRYFRDTDGREVDFVVVEKRSPRLLVECKWGDSKLDPSLRYLQGAGKASASGDPALCRSDSG